MRISRTLRITSIAASVLLGAGVLAGPAAAAPAERPGPGVSALSAPSASSQWTAVRSGHVAAPANDVLRVDRSVTDVHARTIDINRFGYSFGQQNVKFTIRTRDLRNVANRRTYFGVVTTARSSAGEEAFAIEAVGSQVGVYAENGYQRICPEASITRDAARNTVTLRTPLRCITGRSAPSSVQSWGYTVLTDRANETLAFDSTRLTPRIAMRR